MSGLPEQPKPRRIAVITETWLPDINGVSLTINQMVRGMLRRGHQIELYHPQAEAEPLQLIGLQEHKVRGFRLPFYKEVRVGLPAGGLFRKHWRQNPPDLVQIVTEGPLGLSAQRTAIKMKIPVISEFHTNFQQYTRYYHLGFFFGIATRYLRRFHNQSHLALVATRELEQQMIKQQFSKLAVLARGIDTTNFHPDKRSRELRKQWGLADNNLAFIYVGRIAPEKNLDLAIKAFRAIQLRRPKAKFIIVGDGPARKKLQAHNSDLLFCGMKTGEELTQHYASADLFLSPSKSETFGNTILEAMSSQLGIVCFDYAAAKEHLRNENNALTVPMDDDQQFIKAAVMLAELDIYRQSLAEAAREAAESISWDSICGYFEQYMYQLTPEVQHD